MSLWTPDYRRGYEDGQRDLEGKIVRKVDTFDRLRARVAELEEAGRAVVSMWLLYGRAPKRLEDAIDALEDVIIAKAPPTGSEEPR